jgi:dienelactone hydrolase
VPGSDTVITTAGGSFDCYLSAPVSAGKAPGIVMASTVFGVDADLRKMCDDLAAQGFLAAAPDFFWRGDKGPLPRTEEDRNARVRAPRTASASPRAVGERRKNVLGIAEVGVRWAVSRAATSPGSLTLATLSSKGGEGL